MPDGCEPLSIKVLPTIGEVDPAAWDACAGSDPFTSHGFLSALEESGSSTAETGWLPQHLVIEDHAGELQAAAPLYLKNHSYGEYVFDWGWADAYERAGGKYYPKLQSAVPFTPITGRRLLIRGDIDHACCAELETALIAGMVQHADRIGVSSFHITFPTKSEWETHGQHGLLQRVGEQFHWQNHGYTNFNDFLSDLTSRKRKQIRKERNAISKKNLNILTLIGNNIEEHHWDAFYRFYCNTSDRKWGSSYLRRAFFSLLSERAGDKVVLFMVENDQGPVAGALNLIGGDTLYGRNWGCDEQYKFLHFETCYYQAIQFAIEHQLNWVEAGAQGPHKLQRGYLPRRTFSLHWIADPGFRDAVEQFLADERRGIEREIAYLGNHSPFRNRDND